MAWPQITSLNYFPLINLHEVLAVPNARLRTKGDRTFFTVKAALLLNNLHVYH